MDEIEEKLTRARISLLLQQPFWGTLATRLILKDARDDPRIKTASTDGRYFYFNPEFIKKLNKEETKWIFGHIVEHNVYDHMGRRGGRKRGAWGAACDFVVNQELFDHNIGRMPDQKLLPPGMNVYFDPQYKGKFAEEVYELLAKEPNREWTGIDFHMDPEDSELSEEEQSILRDEMRNAVMEAAKAAGGNTPAGIRRMLKDLTEPQMDWRQLLEMKLQSMFKSDFTWSRCSRKSQAYGIFLPGQDEGTRVEAAVALDASASMTEAMLRDQLSEVKGIMQQFTDFKLHVWTFDTEVHNPVVFTPDTLDEIDYYEVKGGGGTVFECNWEYMAKNDITPERFIMFTDGYPNRGWGIPEFCDTLFVIHGDPHHRITAPFGMTAWYEEAVKQQR
jgi:predicted metal-dependent peptidase